MTPESPMATESEIRTAPIARRSPTHELATLGLGAIIYFGGRALVEGSEVAAFRNANRLLDLEEALGIDVEVSIQRFALDHSAVRHVSGLSYVWLHWPLLLTVLLVLFVRDQKHYLQLRNAMFASGAVGLVFFATLPMAPPRFLDGFVGTVSDDARRHYIGYPLSWANQYAALPSFHVGWTLIACLALAASFRSHTAGALAIVPAVLVGISVITTGNHYMLDSIVGGVVAFGAYAWMGHRANQRRPHGSINEQRSDVAHRLGTFARLT